MKLKYKLLIIGTIVSLSSISCVQKEHLKTITFKLDMRSVENISEVGIAGELTPTAWGEILPLLDIDGDGIYEATFSQETAYNGFEFKFTHNGVYELEGQENRELVLEYKPETLVYNAVFNDRNGTVKRID